MRLVSRWGWLSALGIIVALLGLASTGLAATAGPPPGTARIWVYRDYEPYVTLATPYVRLNGAIAGVSEPGGAFCRDVPAGTYQVTVDQRGIDVNQFATIAVAPGQTVYVKVDADNSWSGICRRCEIDTFYTWLVPPALAQAEMSRGRQYGGG